MALLCGMKQTKSPPPKVSPPQAKDSPPDGRQDDGTRRGDEASGGSESEKASAQARRGEPLPAENKRDRSPKQENL